MFYEKLLIMSLKLTIINYCTDKVSVKANKTKTYSIDNVSSPNIDCFAL